jgi:hypothetical protein
MHLGVEHVRRLSPPIPMAILGWPRGVDVLSYLRASLAKTPGRRWNVPAREAEKMLKEIPEKLDLAINLLAFLVVGDKSISEGARVLKMAGLDNRTIAGVLNTTEGTVRTVTSNLRTRVGRGR